MDARKTYEVIIVGGSYAGLSAAMALGRSLRQVLIIDSGRPCNVQTPHSHNFLTQDGETPQAIRAKALMQVLKYPSVSLIEARAVRGGKTAAGFYIETDAAEVFSAKKVLFATGVLDIMPDIQGFAACWGISVLHCPYCHGYEVRGRQLGVIGNGDLGYELSKLISQWSKALVLFTNGPSALSKEQTHQLESKNIRIVEKRISSFQHQEGYLQYVVFNDGSQHELTALFARTSFVQHCSIPEELGCAITEHGFVEVDDFHKTTIPGIYAAGDNCSVYRAVAAATAAGVKAGAFINKELIEDTF
ncbi:thioredoxin reductase [Flammeovirgaceae bacterium 311]|nr:thioredoxin reductase [Flammeovirgaceae bacterium 311]